jgi:hypothetical protein
MNIAVVSQPGDEFVAAACGNARTDMHRQWAGSCG